MLLHSKTTRLGSILLATSLIFALGCSDDDDENNKKSANTNKSTATSTSTSTGTSTTDTNTMMTGTSTTDTNTMMTGTSTSTGTSTTGGETARAAVIHLLRGGGTVDIYVDDTKAISVDEFASTPFVDIPAAVEVKIDVRAGGSAPDSAPLLTLTDTLEKDAAYTIAALGDTSVTTAGEIGAPDLAVAILAQETSPADGNVDVRLIHGSFDAPNVTINNMALAGTVAGALVTDVPYKAITADYIKIPTSGLPYGSSALVDINDASNNDAFVTNFQTPDLTGFDETPLVLAAAGSVTAGDFRILAFNPAGGAGTPLPTAARVQVIHNSPSPAAAEVDILLKSGDAYAPFVNDVKFQTASPYFSAPIGVPLVVGVDIDNSGDPAVKDVALGTLASGDSKVFIASGLVGDGTNGFEILPTDGRENGAADGSVALNIHHGIPAALNVGVRAVPTTAGAMPIVLAASTNYKDFTGYLDAPAASVVLELFDPATGDTLLPTGPVDLATLPKPAINPAIVIASGNDATDAKLIVVGADGTVTPIEFVR